MPKWIIKWAPQFLGQANKKDLLAESRSSSSRQESCEQNVESGWFRAVLIPEHKFWRLAGGRRSPTPMTLHLRIAGRQKIFSKNLKEQKKKQQTCRSFNDLFRCWPKQKDLECHMSCLLWHWAECGCSIDVWVIIVSWTFDPCGPPSPSV